jgi:hypothetical protein
MKILKRRVDKWSPWGTPDGTLNLGEQKFRYLTI